MKALYYKQNGEWVIREVSYSSTRLYTLASNYAALGVATKIIPYLGGCPK